MIFNRLKRRPMTGSLKAIYVAPTEGAEMQLVNSVEAIKDRGLEGDRYCSNKGYWKSIDACQVTLICEDDIDHAIKGASDPIRKSIINGGHRRNLVIDGIKNNALEGKSFRIGGAIFVYEKNRPPCAYIDRVVGQGMCKALGHHSGICIKVVESGVITAGDVINIIE